MRSLLLTLPTADAPLATALQCGADAIILALDAVVELETRERERRRVAGFIAEARAHASGPLTIVSLSARDEAEIEADLDAIMPIAPWAILLSRCRQGRDVQRLGAKLAVREAKYGLTDGATRVFAGVAQSAIALSGLVGFGAPSPRLAGLVWDAEALAADIGGSAPPTPARRREGPLKLARDLTLIGAVAAGVAPIDAAFPWLDDPGGLQAEAAAARADGFAGKIAVHPDQVAAINAIFATPRVL